jgi:CheY-like chemotaxis protein
VKAPTRILVLEDIDTWAYTLSRAARRAGASEVVVCENLHMAERELRAARFDVAILDIGLDPDDDGNSDGTKALEMIREKDGGGTRCVLVTGWQGGDRLDLMAGAQQKYGVDWAYMKEKYEARAVIDKLTELLEEAPGRRLSFTTPMQNLCADAEPWRFEVQLVEALSPVGGVRTLYSAASRLISSAIPLVARHPDSPMTATPDGALVGVYWSRALATAVAVGFAPAQAWDEGNPAENLSPLVAMDVIPDLIEQVRERNVQGWLWELPQLGRDDFPG